MRILKSVWLFYRKLMIPTLVLSALLGLIGNGMTGNVPFQSVGLSYMILGLLFHYFIYEVLYSHEYYFYYNLGLSRISLWIITSALNLIIGLIFICL